MHADPLELAGGQTSTWRGGVGSRPSFVAMPA